MTSGKTVALELNDFLAIHDYTDDLNIKHNTFYFLGMTFRNDTSTEKRHITKVRL